MFRPTIKFVAALLVVSFCISRADEAIPADQSPVDYVREVQPLFRKHCLECHGPTKQESDFRVDVRDKLLQGGDFGEPAIVPGVSNDSRLVKFIRGDDPDLIMPPEGERLSADEIVLLRAWIDQGAMMPEAAGTRPTTGHWSFQPLERPEVPRIDGQMTANPIDAFVRDKLRAAGLSSSGEADRTTLIRRLYLIMHGLPPTPDQIEQFVTDQNDNAFESLVERVLDSPHYGERWAQHWLDLVRFGETHGFETNRERPNAWYYRDYVIQALNNDKPYDLFIKEQIAGDALGTDVATGFLVAGPCDLVKGQDPMLALMQRQDELADMINTTGTAFLGLTLGCARCHSHKFDPITQRDYYSIQAIFAGVQHAERALPLSKENEQALASATNRVEALRDKIKGQERDRLSQSQLVYAGTFSQPGPTHRLYRGEPTAPREEVTPDALEVIGTLGLERGSPEQQRRITFANWIADPRNPLTARVMVNRIWQHHFGVGIVDTPSDFGANGTSPSHPELLDWLAAEFISNGWSIKHMHRLILRSETFRQTSAPHTHAMQVDVAARLLWRFPSRRLEAEAVRDCVLAVSGALDRRMGGPGFSGFEVEMENVRHYHPKQSFGPEDWRRMIYMTKVRQERDAVFGVFDCPDLSQVLPQRSRSTTPLQALNLFNSKFMLQQAEMLAKRLERERTDKREQQIELAFWLCFGRGPDANELAGSIALAQDHGLVAVSRALLNSNEFLFVP